MSVTDCWCSPVAIGDALWEFFEGPVDVDPCSNSLSVIRARTALTVGGLLRPWMHQGKPGSAYENFPYSTPDAWTAKALKELAAGHVTELIRLSMMCTSTQWWADICTKPKRNPRVLGLKRLRFIDPRPAMLGAKHKPPQVCRFEPALVYIGPRPERFTKTFAHLTRWATWGRSCRG